MRVHFDAVGRSGRARRDQRAHRGADADADDDQVGREDLAAGEAHRRCFAVPPLDRFDGDAGADVDTMGAMLGLVET